MARQELRFFRDLFRKLVDLGGRRTIPAGMADVTVKMAVKLVMLTKLPVVGLTVIRSIPGIASKVWVICCSISRLPLAPGFSCGPARVPGVPR